MHVLFRARYCCTIVVAGLLVTGCNEPTTKMKAYTGEGFLLHYPSELSASQETPVEDFQIHTLKRDKEVVLTFYAGNHPNFPSEELRETGEQKTSVHGLAVRSITRILDDGRQDREVLVDLSNVNDWPQYLHFSYSSLSPELVKTADAIIASVEWRKSPGKSL